MRSTLTTFLLLLTFCLATPAGLSAQRLCPICKYEVDPQFKVHWGRSVFCSEACKDEHLLDRFKCKVCDQRTTPPARRRTYSDGMFVYIETSPPKWDGLCEPCRASAASGLIDPETDRLGHDSNDSAPAAAPSGETAPKVTIDETKRKGKFLGMSMAELIIGLTLSAVFFIGAKLRSAA